MDDSCIPALQDYLISLSKKGYFSEIQVITFNYPHKQSLYHWNDIKVHSLGLSQKSTLKSALTLRKAYRAVKSHVLKNRPSLIHSFWFRQSAVIGQKISASFHIPHICTMMGQDVLKTNYWKRLMPTKNLCLVAVSENQKSFCSLEVTKVIPWGVNPAVIDIAEEKEKEYDVLGVGSLIGLKSFERFIDIINLLKQKHPKIKSIIIGDGPEKERLQMKIQRLELQENIHLTGLLSRKETLKIMSRSRVLLHTSKFESFCMVIAEALTLGLFTVSDRIGIAGEHTNSYLASTNEKMALTISSIFNLKQPKQSVLVYNVEKTTQLYLQVYDDLMSHKNENK
jgi:glycosyltransferase involved in cell wall biosynthesis